MNQKFKFLWVHIIAYLAMVALCYLVFVGVSFESGGDFRWAAVVMAAVWLMLMVFFIGAQQLKVWDGDFRKLIWWERAFVLALGPLSLVVAAWPVADYLGIRRQQPQLVEQFACAIDTSKVMFADYEAYANERIEDYDRHIGRTYYPKTRGRSQTPVSPLERQNRLRALRLLLLSPDYDALQRDARQWIDDSKGGTVTMGWFLNVFLMGNIDEIQSAIDGWNRQLTDLSARRLSDEPADVAPFAPDNANVAVAKSLLSDLKRQYRQRQSQLSVGLWLTMLVFWLLLMSPYLLQRRNTKSPYRLFGKEKSQGWNIDDDDEEGGGWRHRIVIDD